MHEKLIKKINDSLKMVTPEEQVHILKAILIEHPELRDAVVVRVFDNSFDMDMYGRTVSDRVTKSVAKRYSIQIHPYVWRPSGASLIPIWKNKHGVPYVALVINKRKDPNEWLLPEGFSHFSPCKGAKDVSLISPDLMDQAEELILKENMNVSEAYDKVVSANPKKAKVFNSSISYDNNLEDTARREAMEEIGLDISMLPLQRLGGKTNGIIEQWYLVDLNHHNSPFKSDENPPRLTADGSEIVTAQWISVNDISLTKQNDLLHISVNEKSIPIEYALKIGQALTMLKNKIINAESRHLFSERQNMAKHLKYFHYSNNKEVYHKLFGHNPGKSLRLHLGINSKEELLEKISNIPGNTKQVKFENWNCLASLSNAGVSQSDAFIQHLSGNDTFLKKRL